MKGLPNGNGRSNKGQPLEKKHRQFFRPSQRDLQGVTEKNLREDRYGEQNDQEDSNRFHGVLQPPPKQRDLGIRNFR